MDTAFGGLGSLAVLLIVLSHANAQQDPAALCLLQTGAALQRSSVPTDFFEVEDLKQSLAPATGVHAQQVGRTRTQSEVAPFDVGSDAIPLPQQNRLGSGLNDLQRELISLAEVASPLAKASAIPAQQLLQEQQALSEPQVGPQKNSADLDQLKAKLKSLDAFQQHHEMDIPMELPSAPPAQSMEVQATEPPVAPQESLQVPEFPEAQLPQQETERSRSLYVEETPEDAAAFVEQQADAGVDDSMDADQQPRDVAESKRRRLLPLARLLQERFRDQQARQEAMVRKPFTALPSMREGSDTSQKALDAIAQTHSSPSRQILPQELQYHHDSPPRRRASLDEDAPGADEDLDRTMAKLAENERRLLSMLSRQRRHLH